MRLNRRGFTLIELSIAALIVGVLYLLTPCIKFAPTPERQQKRAMQYSLHKLLIAADSLAGDSIPYPSTLAEIRARSEWEPDQQVVVRYEPLDTVGPWGFRAVATHEKSDQGCSVEFGFLPDRSTERPGIIACEPVR